MINIFVIFDRRTYGIFVRIISIQNTHGTIITVIVDSANVYSFNVLCLHTSNYRILILFNKIYVLVLCF